MRASQRFPYPRPAVRPLKIYAFDPMVGRKISVDTRNEPLAPGPRGARVVVVDYDGDRRCYYTPANLDDPAVLMQGGIEYAEGDPRFHQQMVYAVCARIVEIFDRALGRPVRLGGHGRPLRLFPHAMNEANAFYDPRLGAILFGYFRASAEDAGANLPGQYIFTCLSHDVIAHELTHALIDGLSPKLIAKAHPDTYALHEGLADLVPILHRFSFHDVLRDEIRRTRGNLDLKSPLVHVASQFGAAMGKKHGLRSAIPSEVTFDSPEKGPHDRGAVFMAAVFEALFDTYRARVDDLFQIAGAARTEPGEDLHPDLVDRMTAEASRVALTVLTMCIRAFDYLPPVYVAFGDFLRALITADRELVPDDSTGLRARLIESFRRRRIYPLGARSLAEESLVWDRPDRAIPRLPPTIVSALTRTAQSFRRIRTDAGEPSAREKLDDESRAALESYARTHATALHLSRRSKPEISHLHHSFRVAPDGQLVIEIIVQIVQGNRGVTVIAAADGSIRYVIPSREPPPQTDPNVAPDVNPDVQPEPEMEPEPHALALTSGRDAGADDPGPPFPERFRIEPDEFARLHPQLRLTRREIRGFWYGSI